MLKAGPDIPPPLIDVIEREALQPVPDWIRYLATTLRERHGASVQAILCYGSCMSARAPEGIADFYVLVDTYRHLYTKRLPALLNRLLPPNVFYLEAPFEGDIARAKYAVISRQDFERGTSMKCFHSYLWGRFSQPARIVFTQCPEIQARTVAALARAVLTFLTRIAPQLPEHTSLKQLWQRGFLLSYGAELRAERSTRAAHLFALAPAYYRDVTAAGAAALALRPVEDSPGATDDYRTNFSTLARGRNREAWRLRRAQGKLISVLRLLKSALTFNGGLDYLAWKIQRHSGVQIEITPRMRRHSILAGLRIFWRTYRCGGFR